jgi:hypothetical protein
VTTSLNGWAGISTSGPALARRVVPGTGRAVTLQVDALPLFLAFLADWHKTVMPIDGKPTYLGPDGWEYREARTGAGLSNHASGTAVDVRYDVLKADHQRHMTDAQIAAVHRLLDKYVDKDGRRVFGWGGDWKVGVYCDEMHTELAQSWAIGARGRATTKADVLAVVARLGIRPDGTQAAPAAPLPVVNLADLSGARALLPSRSAYIVNTALKAEGVLGLTPVRSYWSPGARAAFLKWRNAHGFTASENRAAFIALGKQRGYTVA